jgi:Putative abortive phage resistance protein AbiGi, antitoxin
VSRDIAEVLNRRDDLSTFVVHLTRNTDKSAKDNLKAIIASELLEARNPFGWAKHASDKVRGDSQNVVCFTETPLDQIYLQLGQITYLGKPRKFEFEPYGLAFTKVQARARGVNPVWYVDRTAGHGWKPFHALNELLKFAVDSNFQASPLAALFPLFEPMYRLKKNEGVEQKESMYEWWWEREWRHVGSMHFNPGKDVAFYLCPEADMAEFKGLLEGTRRDAGMPPPPCIDPAWGLERILAHLLKLPHSEISPFAD